MKVTSDKINEAVEATWAKLQQAVSRELDKVLAGEAELSASTTAAVVKFVECSRELASDPYITKPDLSHLYSDLPEFDDDGERIEKPQTTTSRRQRRNKD